ncbi:hypothetical protein ACFL6U_13925 [Planctomycetota bacterium]
MEREGEVMRHADIHKTMKKWQRQASSELDERVHSGIDTALAEAKQKQSVPTEPQRWRIIMKSSLIKFAAAAIVVVAITLGFLPGNPTITFAQVIEPILNWHTIALDLIVGEEGKGPVIHDIIKGNRIRRTMSNDDTTVMIMDLETNKMLVLDTKTKGAAYIDIQGELATGTRRMLDLLRTIVTKVAENPSDRIQDLGRRDFDGVEAIGFEVKERNVTIRLWADLETSTPKRIEMDMGQSPSIIKNIEFDIPVSEKQVSMEPPAGYTLAFEEAFPLGESTEEDLIATLGLWADRVRGGTFPNKLSMQELLNMDTKFTTAIEQLGSEQEQGLMRAHFTKALMYLHVIDADGEWNYRGQGVAFGDSKTAVFWYRRGNAKTYRVIYGDLHVEDVPLDRLPQ